MKQIRSELALTHERSYDRLITVSLFDKGLNEMAAEINNNLIFQKHLKLESERAETTMRQSVSDIAHDLRTPLTVIKGNLQLIDTEEKLSVKGSNHLRICREKTDILKAMMDEFFELSVLESNDTQIQIRRLDATNIFLQFFADSEAVISQSGLIPQITFPEKSIFIDADEQMILRILGNLLNNTVKYAVKKFNAGISAEKDKCIIFFSNDLAPEHQPDPELLFERSYRSDRSRKAGSAGLGLYIVKILTQKQGATVSASVIDDQLKIIIEFTISE